MDWVLGLIILSAVLIGVLGIGEIIVWFTLGADSVLFEAIAMAQAFMATVLAVCFAISFVYILYINQ